jgi:hypothetical protein
MRLPVRSMSPVRFIDGDDSFKISAVGTHNNEFDTPSVLYTGNEGSLIAGGFE